ncbi:MAG: sugar transferase [Patescibacteria group bacterium]
MKKSELFFSALLVPVDYLMIVLAALAAYGLRFGSAFTDIIPVIYEIPFREFFNIVLIVAVGWIAIFALSGLYNMRGQRKNFQEISKIFFACSTAIMAVIIFIFFRREFFSSRFIILSTWFFSIFFVSLAHLIIRAIQSGFYRRGIGIHRLVVIGQDTVAEDFIKQIYRKPNLGLKIVERYPQFDDKVKNRMREMAEDDKIDEVILADANMVKETTLDLIDFCDEYHLVFKYAADLFEAQATNLEVQTIAGIPIIEIKKTSLEGWGKVSKRMFDIFFSVIIGLILSPIFLLIGIIIKIDSKGPILVQLQRVGKGGKVFTLYKFRSMIKDAHSLKKDLLRFNERRDGPLFKMKHDPRITRVGRFLRKSSLDEFPQLINVIKGQMSMVGPRPHEPEEVARYDKHHKKLLAIKPGLTGLAQVSGRSDLGFEQEVKLDTYYIENWSVRLDLQIIFRTPFILVIPRKAP